MRALILAGAAALALCGPARAFDFTADRFGDLYNAATRARGWPPRLDLRACDDGATHCSYTFGPGTRAEVDASPAGPARSVTFAFDWHARSLPGLRTAPQVMMDILGVSPETRLRVIRDVFSGDIVAYGRGPAPVTVDGVSYRATDPSPADEVTYSFVDGTSP